MVVFLRYLAILLIHLIWRQIGGRGPTPPIRIPKRNPVTVPEVSAWQIFVALWLVQSLWKQYGDIVKQQMKAQAKQRIQGHVKTRYAGAREKVARRFKRVPRTSGTAAEAATDRTESAPRGPEMPVPETAAPPATPIPGMPAAPSPARG